MVMTNPSQYKRSANPRGFSLVEMMVAMVVLLLVIGGVLQLLSQSQQRYVSTANVEDSTAMAREAVDLMAREIRLAGYPPPNSYPTGAIMPGTNEQYVATAGGFLAFDPNGYAVQFEADAEAPAACGSTMELTDSDCASNTGVVSQIDYQLQIPTIGVPAGCMGLTPNAALTSVTLMRSQLPKDPSGTPRNPAPADFVPFVNDVANCEAGIPIFTPCPPAAPAGGCPDLSGQRPSTLPAPANTRVVLIRLQVQTRNPDPQTGQFQIVEFYSVAEKVNPEQ